jgi:hypothetical protein
MIYRTTLWWTNILLWKDPPFFMGKSTISMAIFNSKLLVHQRVVHAGYKPTYHWGYSPWTSKSSVAVFRTLQRGRDQAALDSLDRSVSPLIFFWNKKHVRKSLIWANYNNSLTWNVGPVWDDSPHIKHDSRVRENSEIVIICQDLRMSSPDD